MVPLGRRPEDAGGMMMMQMTLSIRRAAEKPILRADARNLQVEEVYDCELLKAMQPSYLLMLRKRLLLFTVYRSFGRKVKLSRSLEV